MILGHCKYAPSGGACAKQAIGGSAGGDVAKEPESEFVTDNPEWLADSAPMAVDFVDTPACQRLKHGRMGVHVFYPYPYPAYRRLWGLGFCSFMKHTSWRYRGIQCWGSLTEGRIPSRCRCCPNLP